MAHPVIVILFTTHRLQGSLLATKLMLGKNEGPRKHSDGEPARREDGQQKLPRSSFLKLSAQVGKRPSNACDAHDRNRNIMGGDCAHHR